MPILKTSKTERNIVTNRWGAVSIAASKARRHSSARRVGRDGQVRYFSSPTRLTPVMHIYSASPRDAYVAGNGLWDNTYSPFVTA